MTELDEQTKLNIACCFYQMQQAFQETESERQRPHVLMRPKLFPDGDRWCALYGADLQEGVAGFGESPDNAMMAFDAAWYSKANTQGLVTPGTGQSAENAPASRRHQ